MSEDNLTAPGPEAPISPREKPHQYLKLLDVELTKRDNRARSVAMGYKLRRELEMTLDALKAEHGIVPIRYLETATKVAKGIGEMVCDALHDVTASTTNVVTKEGTGAGARVEIVVPAQISQPRIRHTPAANLEEAREKAVDAT